MQKSGDVMRPSSLDGAGVCRDLPATAERALIIGLDGATFDVLNPMMEAGRMPNLKAFIESGVSGVWESTKPPITPAAWTTFMTGKRPGTHGVIDFERYDVQTHRLSFNSTQSVGHVRTIWQILGDKGLRVGAINVPMMYPPRPVNGFVITGFETPGIDAEFTYPAELKAKILSRWPDYTFKTNWKRKTFGGERVFAENLRAVCRSFHEGAAVTRYCGDEFGWDALMVVFKLVDNLQHKTWKYLDPRFNTRVRGRAEKVAACFDELDQALGELFDYAGAHGATVLIMSDHGHGSLEGKVQPNLLLKEWGYLQLKEGGSQTATRSRYVLDRLFSRRKGRFATQRQIDEELAVDFSRTRACVMHAGIYAFLYVNLQGRQPGGVVPAGEYEAIRDELTRRFLGSTGRGPSGREIRLFPEVLRPEDIYDCNRDDQPWMPDLMLVPAEGLAAVRKIRGSTAVRWLPWRKIEGTHRLEGVFAAGGPGVARGRRVRAGIIDIAPTTLAMLGIRVPDDMEGEVIESMFERPLHFETESSAEFSHVAGEHGVYSEAEEQILTQRLADLGYLE